MARAYNNNSSYLEYISVPDPHLLVFIVVVFFVFSVSWYLNYESALEETLNQVKIFLMLSPLLLLLLLHLFSGDLSFFLPLPEQDSIHRAGASPWGVAVVLVVILFMVSYQSYFHDRWFPLGAK